MKKGQATIFVIIGIVIVLLAILFYFFRTDLGLGGLKPTQIEVPTQAEGVNTYIKNCIEDNLETAVQRLSAQGGYIEFPTDPINTGTFSNTLTLFGSHKVAIWNYLADNNVLFNQKPTLTSMEAEISNYITNSLRTCLGEFTTFQDFSVQSGRILTQTDIQDKRIVTKVTFPVQINKGDFQFQFNEFYISKESPLKELFEIAEKVYEEEENSLFLEKRTIGMLSVYNEIPYVGETSDCIAPTWTVDNVKRDFKNILRTNIQALKVKGTNYALTREKDKFLEINANVNNPEANAQFMFSEIWPVEMDIYPQDNGLLKGYSVTEALGELRGIAESFVCLSTYEFIYTLKYPVLLALNKEDLTFQFSMMAYIDRNEPRQNTQEFLSTEQYDQRFCNEQIQFIVDTVDQDFNNLNSVEVKYKCINHLCDLGTSDRGIWQGRVPLCINGEFIGNKEGYHTGKSLISTNIPGSALLVLEKLKEIEVEVLITRAGSGELRPGESAHISLTDEFKGFRTTIIYPEQKTVKLIPGVYKTKVLLTSPIPQGLRVPEKRFTSCYQVPKGGILGTVLGSTEEKCEEIKIPATTINQIVTGTEEFSFSIAEENLKAKKIRFWAPWQGTISDISQLANLTKQQGRPPEFHD
ncbi:MAG: hypothetical protein ABIB47_02550 [Candidatus Woesearchaeota archaeon]